ncbi:MAG: hypothetical protein MK212_10580 [Saprospiraceae bacterium]|nr:hypothetical protein [Saprospiraceae bacterium]
MHNKRINIISFLILFLSLHIGIHAQVDEQTLTEEEKKFMKRQKFLTKVYTGMYSNEVQEKADDSPNYGRQKVRFYTIWEDYWFNKRPEVWWYFGWYSADIDDNPLVEYIARTRPASGDTLLTEFYYIDNPKAHREEWHSPAPFHDIDPTHLVENKLAPCKCYVIPSKDAEARMFSVTPCPYKGSIGSFRYFTFKADIKAREITAYNIYYNKNFQITFDYKDGNNFKLKTRTVSKFSPQKK